jgi:predicted nucleotidyltransferase
VTRHVKSLLTEMRQGLEELYGPRLCGVFLFGSYARGEEDAESDVDVLIVLDCLDRYAAEVERTGFLASELSLRYGVSISRVIIPQADWLAKRTPFLASLAEECVGV